MKQMLKSIALFFFILLLLTAGGCSALTNPDNAGLQASGIIETEKVAVASELAGRVTAVNAKEGQPVKTGDVLITLDDSMLNAQRQAAEAALASAQTAVQSAQTALNAAELQYDMTLARALEAEQATRTDRWKKAKPAPFDLPAWYFSDDEQYQAIQTAIEAADAALVKDQAILESMEQKAGSAQFIDSEKRLLNARVVYSLAQQLLEKANRATSGRDLRDAAQKGLDDAKIELDNAQEAYEEALTTEGAKDVLEARAKVAVAQERCAMARDALRAMQTGARSPEVTASAYAVEQAQAGLEQARAQVNQAQANLDLFMTQIDRLNVRAPQDGVILTRSVQPGEILPAGTPALTIGQLDQLKVTVYLPEDRYGEVKLGDQAELTADSFPNRSFPAIVTRIADEAEFTPRNVQTKEQRQTTVYAVELSLDNPERSLKPGMPVDVTFGP